MSETNGQAWGMCAAFGCPLLGTLGSDGTWFCFCHVGKPSVFNDAITRELREKQGPVVDLTFAIRRDSLLGRSDQTGAALRALKAHELFGELRFNGATDKSARAWLQRLERHLIESTEDIGEQKRIASTVPTKPVVGPTHATQHFSETVSELAERAEERV